MMIRRFAAAIAFIAIAATPALSQTPQTPAPKAPPATQQKGAPTSWAVAVLRLTLFATGAVARSFLLGSVDDRLGARRTDLREFRNLVRANVASFARFIKEARTIDNPTIGNDDLIVDAGFLKGLADLNRAATGANVKLFINQAFRVEGVSVGGAVVPPATKSQHLIGHAIDCNTLASLAH